jgi:serine/threonine protein kinase
MNETLTPTDRSAADCSAAVDLQEDWVAPSSNADDEGTAASPSSNADDEGRTASPVRVGCVIRNRYVLEERVGIGGKGTVFKALDRYRSDLPEEDRYVAIKVLHRPADNRGDLVADLRREFYCAQTLSHQNIVNVYQLDRDGDIDFFTMELLEGELLSGVLARLHPAPMSRPQAWAIIRDIGSGLAHAHSRNVIHADLMPHNIMITHSGEVRILDFSNAVGHYSEDTARRSNTLSSGALSYASCEILAGRAPDPRDDVYALACLSYELLAGEHPFQRRPATEARALGIVPRRPPGLSRQQWQTLAMGLSWHRAGRSNSVRDWLNRLNIDRAATQSVLPVRDLQTAPVDHRATVPLRATTMFVVLLMTVSVWVSFVRWAAGSRATGDDAVPVVVANPPGRPDQQSGDVPVATNQNGAPAVADSAVHAVPSTAPPRTAEGPPRLSGNPGHGGTGRPKQSAGPDRPLLVSAGNHTVRSDEHFAEIRVRRSSLSSSDTQFVWWTEAASAKPGIDYVHQSKVIQSFPKGKKSMSFFIKLVPRASRARREVFYVAIAEAGRGASADPVARAAVWLPVNQDHSQAAAPAEHGAHAESYTPADSRFSTAALGSPLPQLK